MSRIDESFTKARKEHMAKRRDAGTGKYISQEEAKSRPSNTWVEETMSDKQYILRSLYEALLARAGYAECEDFESVKVENITKVFQDAGLKNS